MVVGSNSFQVDQYPYRFEEGGNNSDYDDDGRPCRTGTWMTASAHIITAVIGSGVLSLSWALAQLGWVVGPTVLLIFAMITYFTSTLLSDCYRAPDPVTGKRNYTYVNVVKSHLGGRKTQMCGIAQYGNLMGITIGYTITAAISMVAIKRSGCFHKNGHDADCDVAAYPYMIVFMCIQLVLSQIPDFANLSFLSVIAAVMSFAYAAVGLGLSIAKAIDSPDGPTSITGTQIGVDVTAPQKAWRTFQAVGNIAFSYAFSTVLVEIQDTLKSSPPENLAMKKASGVGVLVTTAFYMLCGCTGYAAFGNNAPGNFLTGFGFYEPFWLIDFANVCIAVHLVGAYQVFAQPLFGFIEGHAAKRWPDSEFINGEYPLNIPLCGEYNLNIMRLVWRTIYVMLTSIFAMLFPFFNDFLGLIGACSFYPLTVYFPIEMYIARTNIRKNSSKWIWLKMLSLVCLVVSLVAAIGSLQGLYIDVKTYKPFQNAKE